MKKKNKKGPVEIQLMLPLWEAIATQRDEIVKRSLHTMESCLDPTDWLIVHVGEKVKCSMCCKDVQRCICTGGAVVRHDHEILRVGDIRQNIGNALTDLALLGGFPDGTIIAAKMRKTAVSGEIGFKLIESFKINPIAIDQIEDLVNWDAVTKTLLARTRYKDRLSVFSKGGFIDEPSQIIHR